MKEIFNDFLRYDDENQIKSLFYSIKEEKLSSKTSYYNVVYDTKYLIDEVNLLSDGVSKIVVIGIGGSVLGTKAIYHFLYPKKEIIFLDTLDIRYLLELLKKVDKNSKFIIVSKSGKTIETIAILKLVLSYFNFDLKKDFSKFIVISDEGSDLCKFADEYKIKVYTIPKNLNSRFSVFSAVGIVPLTLAGIDTKKILFAAQEFEERFFNFQEVDLIKKALFIAKRSENILFSYSNYLETFNKWYIHLIAESLAKRDKNNQKVGITPISLIGPMDQHTFLQLIVEGPQDKIVTFIKVKDFKTDKKIENIFLKYLEESDVINNKYFSELINKEAHAIFNFLSDKKIPATFITLDSFNEEEIGNLMMSQMILTSLIGIKLGINPYDQPIGEISKKIVRQKFKE